MDKIKLLLAEDDTTTLFSWARALENIGFNLAGKSPRDIALEARGGLVRLNYGHHEIHITGHAPTLNGAVKENKYALCFLDGGLVDGLSYFATKFLLEQESPPNIILISFSPQLQLNLLGELVVVNSFFEKGVLKTGSKNVQAHISLIKKTFGIKDSSQNRCGIRPQELRL